jgi:WhiB family redox-sensing transcriptional regulator
VTALPIEPQPWYDQAACLDPDVDPEIFFPGDGERAEPAKRICQGCPVMDECRDWALANDERFGVWGGLSERERRRVKKDSHWNRTKTHCTRDHPLSGDNLWVDPRTGERVCKACRAWRKRQHYARQRGYP